MATLHKSTNDTGEPILVLRH